MIDIVSLKNNISKIDSVKLKILTNDEELKCLTGKDKITFVDEFGYKYNLNTQNISVLSRRKTSIPNRFFHNNIYTKYNINNYFKLNNIKLELITDNPTSAIDDIEFKCLIHNEIFARRWNTVKNGSIMCPTCEIESFREKRCIKIEKIEEEWMSKWGVKLISKKYENNLSKLKFMCNKHEDMGIQEISWGNSLDATHICKYCLKEIVRNKMSKTQEQFENEIYNIHGDKYNIISSYINSKSKVKVHCNLCREDFYIQSNHLLEGHGCSNCIKSKGEEKVSVYLDFNNINYIREYRFENCIGVSKRLPFDFYLEDYNLCIEYQGKQHYEPIELFGGEKQFEIQQINDNIKRNYCRENNINLLEICYKDFNNVNNILKEYIENITNN